MLGFRIWGGGQTALQYRQLKKTRNGVWSVIASYERGRFQVFADRQARFAAMSAFKSAAIARICSVIRMTGKSLASSAISSKSSESSRSVCSRFLCSSILARVPPACQMKVDRELDEKAGLYLVTSRQLLVSAGQRPLTADRFASASRTFRYREFPTASANRAFEPTVYSAERAYVSEQGRALSFSMANSAFLDRFEACACSISAAGGFIRIGVRTISSVFHGPCARRKCRPYISAAFAPAAVQVKLAQYPTAGHDRANGRR